jgi:hypothetical protein
MLQQDLLGIPLRVNVASLKEEFDANEMQLYHDWEHRNKWIPQIVQLDDPTLLHKFLEGAKSILPKTWLLFQDTDNPFVKLGALKLIKDTNLGVLDVLQSLGKIAKVAEKVEIEIKWRDSNSQLNMSPTVAKEASMTAQLGTESSSEAAESAKQQPEQTKQ